MPVKPEFLRWACERAGKPESALAEKISAFPYWLTGEKASTLKQLEDFAKATRTPFGFLFLPEPPVETIPIQNMTGTSGRQRGASTAMDHFRLAVRPEALATAFGEIAQTLFDCIRVVMIESRKLAARRDYLLPQLLSGQVPVEVA
ncbi:hypothetical protein [Phenylobacterium sp.]|uniref:hypothetical protein n=1 Tax=Phenylobacterium sp. TaxID=1871053 RepID=UPI0037CC24A5